MGLVSIFTPLVCKKADVSCTVLDTDGGHRPDGLCMCMRRNVHV